jgi:regulatory protein
MQKTITALKIQKNNSNRVNIYLDDKYSFALYKIVALNLKVGQIVNNDEVERLLKKDQEENCYQKALKYIAFKPRTQMDVVNKLRNYDFDEDTILDTIELLLSKGYIDDHSFAQNWVENRSNFKPRSKKLLSWELRKKNVSKEIINQVTEDIPDDDELAKLAAEKYSRRLSGCDKDAYLRKLTGYLIRRGFSYFTIKPIVQESWNNLCKQNFNKEIRNEVD